MAKREYPCVLCGSELEHLTTDCLRELINRTASSAVAEERERLVKLFRRHGYYELAGAIEFEGLP